MAPKESKMSKIECMVSVRMLGKLDIIAKVDGISRNEAVRTVLKEGFDALDMKDYMNQYRDMLEEEEEEEEDEDEDEVEEED